MKKVLLVDDDDAVRKILAIGLRIEGYEVTQAEDGEAALDLLRADPVDVLILDLRMPVMDGHTLLLRLADDGVAPPLVIVLSALESPPAGPFEEKLQRLVYLRKPVAGAALASVIAQYLDSDGE